MNRADVLKLFMIIDNTYSGFAHDDDKVAIWADILQDVPFELAQVNLRRYIRDPHNNFPPHPGVLAATETENAAGPHVPGVEETRKLLDEMDEQYRLPAGSIPDTLREAVRNLGRSISSDAGNGSDEPAATS